MENLTTGVMLCISSMREKALVIVQSKASYARVCRKSRYCVAAEELDLESLYASPQKAIEAIQEICNRWKIDCLIPADIPSCMFLAEHGNRLKGVSLLCCASKKHIEELNNKLSFAKLLDRFGHPQPRYWEINSENEALLFSLSYPIVLKPVNRDGGQGVKICENASTSAITLANVVKFVPRTVLGSRVYSWV